MPYFDLKNYDVLNLFLYFSGFFSLSVITLIWIYEACRDSQVWMLLCGRISISIQKHDSSSDLSQQKFENNAASLTSSQPVTAGKENDINIGDCFWINDFLKLWRQKHSLQVTKWINTWIGSLNESLLGKTLLINRIEIMQVLSDSSVPHIVSICGTDGIMSDETQCHLKVSITQEVLYFKIRSNQKNHTVLLEDIKGQLLVSISLGVSGSISASVKFVSKPAITSIHCSSCNSSAECRIHEEFDQVVNALTQACTHLFFDYSTPENQSSSTLLPTNYSTTPNNQAPQKSIATQLRKSSYQISNPIISNILRSRCLLLKIIKASGLNQETMPHIRTATVHGSRGVFVLVKVDEPFQQHNTSVSATSRDNPFWDQHFILEISEKTNSLSMEVFDRKGNNNDVFLGQMRLFLSEISSASSRMIVPLRGHEESKDEIIGLLTFELLLMEPTNNQPASSQFVVSPPNTAYEHRTAIENELETFMVSPLELDNDNNSQSASSNVLAASPGVGYKAIKIESSSRQAEVNDGIEANSLQHRIEIDVSPLSLQNHKVKQSSAPLSAANLMRSVSSAGSDNNVRSIGNHARRANSAERVTNKFSINEYGYSAKERSHSQQDINNSRPQQLPDRQLGKNRSLSSSFRRLFKVRHRKKNDLDSASFVGQEQNYSNQSLPPVSSRVLLRPQLPAKNHRPQVTASHSFQYQKPKSDGGSRRETVL